MYRKLLLVLLTVVPALASAGVTHDRTDWRGGLRAPQATSGSGQAALQLASLSTPTGTAPSPATRRSADNSRSTPAAASPEQGADILNGYNPTFGDTPAWWVNY